MVRCLLQSMAMVSEKVVNFDKLRETTKLADKNPAILFKLITRNHGPIYQAGLSLPSGTTVLAIHFISQSPPDIRKKLKKAEEGPQTPTQELVKMAFNVFNAREETAVFLLKQAVMLQAHALPAALRPQGLTEGGQGKSTTRLHHAGAQPKSTSLTGSFKCGLNGRLTRYCPGPPMRLCPICQQPGHWKSQCPCVGSSCMLHRGGPVLPTSASEIVPTFELLGLAED